MIVKGFQKEEHRFNIFNLGLVAGSGFAICASGWINIMGRQSAPVPRNFSLRVTSYRRAKATKVYIAQPYHFMRVATDEQGNHNQFLIRELATLLRKEFSITKRYKPFWVSVIEEES